MKMMALTLLILLNATALLTYASGNGVGGYDHGNGGDMCESRFKDVREDLKTWILNGGSAALKLPDNITSEQYAKTMLAKIKKARVSCTNNKLFVGRAEKTCKNFVTDGVSRILCNRKQFQATRDSDQYILVHHEYAGLAGFEVNVGEQSNYEISNQITGYLENKISKKLVVKPRQDSVANPFDSSVCQGPAMTAADAQNIARSYPKEGAEFATFTAYTRERRCGVGRSGECEEWHAVPNRISRSDMSGLYSFTPIPDVGILKISTTLESSQLELYSSERGLGGNGIYLSCESIGPAQIKCSATELPNFSGAGEAQGSITNHCAYFSYYHGAFETPMGKTWVDRYWVQRQTVFISRF